VVIICSFETIINLVGEFNIADDNSIRLVKIILIERDKLNGMTGEKKFVLR
jgi:hypothetical protein